MDVLNRIGELGVVPVVKIEDPTKAVPLAESFLQGGLPLAEITFRTSAAEASIRAISEQVPDVIVGAGTVITTEQVDRAIDAGAKFIVSPGFNAKVVQHCLDRNIPVTPGCSSPSDIEQAIELGLNVVKVFPAEVIGGLSFIKAIAAPYPQMKFLPTGGIGLHNLNEYLANDRIHACGGSWLAPNALLANDDFAAITDIVRETMRQVVGFTLKHIGINHDAENEASKTAALLAQLLGTTPKEGNSSIFVNTVFEVMKAPGLGKHGHIALGVNNMSRAIAFLSNQGFKVDWDTAKYDAKENLKAIYIEGEIANFAIHLVLN